MWLRAIHTSVQVFFEARILSLLGARVMGSCKLCGMGTGNGIQVLCKESKSVSSSIVIVIDRYLGRVSPCFLEPLALASKRITWSPYDPGSSSLRLLFRNYVMAIGSLNFRILTLL